MNYLKTKQKASIKVKVLNFCCSVISLSTLYKHSCDYSLGGGWRGEGVYRHTCFMGYYTGACTCMLVRSLRLSVAVIVVDCHQSFCKSFSAPYPSLPYGKYMVSMIASTSSSVTLPGWTPLSWLSRLCIMHCPQLQSLVPVASHTQG